MVTLSVLDGRLAAQLATVGSDSGGLHVVRAASSVEAFRARASRDRAQVFIVNLDLLGDSPRVLLQSLRDELTPELTIVLFYFAKRDLVASLAGSDCRILRGPVTVSALRAQLTSFLVRDRLGVRHG